MLCLMTFIMCLFFCFTALQIAVMITNGRSDDQVDAAARAVADSGISLFAVGECGSRCCEFLQHPHCSGPSDFIWALPAYLQCLQLEIHVLYIWIRRIQCGYLWACVRMLFLSVWMHTNIYQLCSVCKNKWVVNSAAILSTVYKCAISGTLCCRSKGISSCLFPAHEYILLFTSSISLLTHIFPSFSYTLAWAHKPTTYSSQLGALQ